MTARPATATSPPAPARGRAGTSPMRTTRSGRRRAGASAARGRARSGWSGARRIAPGARTRRTPSGSRGPTCQRSAAARRRGPPPGAPGAAPPSRSPRSPSPRRRPRRRAPRSRRRLRPRRPRRAPFVDRLCRGGPGRVELGVGPLLAGVPIRLEVRAELLAGLGLPARHLRLLAGQIPRPRLAALRTGEAVVRPVPRVEILLAPALALTALHVSL